MQSLTRGRGTKGCISKLSYFPTRLTRICSHGCPFPSAFSAATLALYWTCGLRESTVVEMVLPTPPTPLPPPLGEVTVCTRDRALLTPQGTTEKKGRFRILMEHRQRWMVKAGRPRHPSPIEPSFFIDVFISSTRPTDLPEV